MFCWDRQRYLLKPLALTLICLVSRMTFHGSTLEGVDSIHFAWGLRDYDLVHYRPHFPGYPVYLACSWLMLHLVGDAARALTLSSGLFGSLTVLPLYFLARQLGGDKVATLTALLFIVNPLLWLEACKAYSDTCGLFFLLTAAALGYAALRKHDIEPTPGGARSLAPLYWGSVVFGVMLGARLAYIPFVCTWAFLVYWLCRLRHDRQPLSTALHGLVLGVGVWLVPFLFKVGWHDIALAARMNTEGTVYRYGDTLVTAHNYLGRAVQLYIWNVLVNGLGFWWPDVSLLRLIPTCLGLAALVRFWLSPHHAYDRRACLVWLVPYGVWLYVAQNPHNPRHILPLLPVLLIAIASGLLTRPYWLPSWSGPVTALLLCVSLGGISLPLMYQHHSTLPTRLQLVRYVTQHYDARTTKVYCWWSRRFFQYYAPAWQKSLPPIRRPLRLTMASAPTILITSDLFEAGFSAQDFQLTPVQVFTRNRYLHPWLHSLTLYRLEADYTPRADMP